MNYYVDVKDCVKLVGKSVLSATIKLADGSNYNIQFSKQKTGYDEKTFLECPACGSKREKLYIYNKKTLCRECYPSSVYAGIKNVTKCGYEYIAYRMRNYAKTNGIYLKRFPFCYMDYEKPKFKHIDKWCDMLMKLQALENMRGQAIFLKRRYPIDVINSIFRDENMLLYVCNLYDLNKFFYDWEGGYNDFKVCSKTEQYEVSEPDTEQRAKPGGTSRNGSKGRDKKRRVQKKK